MSHTGDDHFCHKRDMGLTTFVLMLSNMVISLVSGLVPSKGRIPAFVVVIAVFCAVVQLVMQAYVPALYETLEVFHSPDSGELYCAGKGRSLCQQEYTR